MLIFINDDAGCAAWLHRRRNGAAVEGMRDRTKQRLLLHGAGCSRLKNALARGAATTGDRWTACARDASELVEWCLEEYGVEPSGCPNCATSDERLDDDHHLTRLGRDILGYVLDVAIIHLEPDVRPYHLTLGDVAQCLRKTPRQLAGTLERLSEEGLLDVGEPHGRGLEREESRPIYPTAAAMKTLDYYATRGRRRIDADLAKLHEGEGALAGN